MHDDVDTELCVILRKPPLVAEIIVPLTAVILVAVKYSDPPIDFDDLERRARSCNVMILCNPQNPTGNVWSAEELTQIGEICLRHRVVVTYEAEADGVTSDCVVEGVLGAVKTP